VVITAPTVPTIDVIWNYLVGMASPSVVPAETKIELSDGNASVHVADAAFEMLYPIAVGLGRRILDRDGLNLSHSRPLAEDIAIQVFVQLPTKLVPDQKSLCRICRLVTDGCLEALLGDESWVSVSPELLPAETGFSGELPLRELEATLCEMRRSDRRVGLVVLAAGLTPSQAASVLGIGLNTALSSMNRIAQRLHDRQILGLGPKFGADRS
jgi:hypothetical protein